MSPARYVIHTVGPVWKDGKHDEPALLASCYERSLRVAADLGVASLAFPGISTGVYGFPPRRAAPIAIGAVREFSSAGSSLRSVIFCCFSEDDLTLYRQLLEADR